MEKLLAVHTSRSVALIVVQSCCNLKRLATKKAMAAAQDASTAHATRKQRLVSESNKYETVEELLYVNRQKRFLTEEQAQLQMCACKTREADKDGPICTSAQCENVASRTECPMGTCSKKRCQNKRFQRREWAKMEVFEVSAEVGHGSRVSGKHVSTDRRQGKRRAHTARHRNG